MVMIAKTITIMLRTKVNFVLYFLVFTMLLVIQTSSSLSSISGEALLDVFSASVMESPDSSALDRVSVLSLLFCISMVSFSSFISSALLSECRDCICSDEITSSSCSWSGDDKPLSFVVDCPTMLAESESYELWSNRRSFLGVEYIFTLSMLIGLSEA